MDYEKKYKNALEWARQVMTGETGFIRKEVEEVFPELAESEDEKMRKEIIAVFKGEISYTSEENAQKYIAWLEKQGEPTEINPSEFDLHLNKLLKQFESLPKEELISNLSYYLNIIQNDGTYKIEKQGEKSQRMISAEAKEAMYDKPTWSEADEDLLTLIEDSLSDYLGYTEKDGTLTPHSKGIVKLRVIEYIDWIKSLKQRMV